MLRWLWTQLTATLNLVGRGMITIVNTLWGWIMVPLTRLWAGLLFIWHQIRVSATAVWTGLMTAALWLWSNLADRVPGQAGNRCG